MLPGFVDSADVIRERGDDTWIAYFDQFDEKSNNFGGEKGRIRMGHEDSFATAGTRVTSALRRG